MLTKDTHEDLFSLSKAYRTALSLNLSAKAVYKLESLIKNKVSNKKIFNVPQNISEIGTKTYPCLNKLPLQDQLDLVTNYYLSNDFKNLYIYLNQLEIDDFENIYAKLHWKIRENIILNALKSNRTIEIAAKIGTITDHTEFLPLEKYLYYLNLSSLKKNTHTFKYFWRHKELILEQAEKTAEHTQISKNSVILSAASLGIKLNLIKKAHMLLQKIQTSDPEHRSAVYLLETIDSKRPIKTNQIAVNLHLAKSFTSKRNLLDEYLKGVQSHSLNSINTVKHLNYIFSNIWVFFDRDCEQIGELSSLILKYEDCLEKINSLFQIFYDAIFEFRDCKQDHLFWNPLSQLEEQYYKTPQLLYLSGIAKTHIYLSSQNPKSEKIFWQGRSNILTYFKYHQNEKSLKSWEEYSFWLLATAEKLNQMNPLSVGITNIIRIGREQSTFPVELTLPYLNDLHSKPPKNVLDEMQLYAEELNHHLLKLKVQQRHIQLFNHLTNQDLIDYWQNCQKIKRYDSCWIINTILMNRNFSSLYLQKTWQFSADNVKFKDIITLKAKDFDIPLYDFSEIESVLIWSLLKLGPKIREFFLTGVPENLSKPYLFELTRPKEAMDWVKKLAKIPHLKEIADNSIESTGFLNQTSFIEKPKIFKTFKETPWSIIVASLVSYLSPQIWENNLCRLHPNNLGCFSMQNSRQGRVLTPAKSNFRNWLKGFNSEQRQAWYQIQGIINKLSIQQVEEATIKYSMRVALLLNPSHLDALSLLKESRADSFYLWDIEKWLLSEPYYRFRVENSLEYKSIIPTSNPSELEPTP